jgi:antirestriction protein ArdC
MSTPYKPLSEQIAGKMIADLKTGNSIFQRPNNSMHSALPFNLESGNRYSGPSALVLLMQKRDDPRWGTSNQANRNHTAVIKGSTGTLISFMSNYEIQKVFDGDQPVMKDNGKQRTERVKLDEPKLVEAWMFNAEQMRKMEKWEKEPNILSPAERAQIILDNSKAVIENGGDDMFYDSRSDIIVLPEMEQFANPEQFYAEALHQLAHWTAAEGRLNRPHESSIDQLTNLREELRTNLASLFLSKELNLPYELNYHEAYVNSWAALLKDEPGELFKAAEDAQKIVDVVLDFEKQIEQKKELDQDTDIRQQNDTAPEMDVPKINPDKLTKGEIIPHNGTSFEVLSDEKKGKYQMQDLGSERKFQMKTSDVLFGQLLEARNNSQEISAGRENLTEDEIAYHENEAVEEFLDNQLQMER